MVVVSSIDPEGSAIGISAADVGVGSGPSSAAGEHAISSPAATMANPQYSFVIENLKTILRFSRSALKAE
jgi:hypothetical protein